MKKKFTLTKRLDLEHYLKKKVTNVTRLSELMGYSDVTLYKEIKMGLSEEDWESRNYSNYDAELAQYRVEVKLIERERQ